MSSELKGGATALASRPLGLASEAKAFADAHTGSPIGVGDDVVWWCHTQRYQPVFLNVTNPSSSTRLRIHIPQSMRALPAS